MSKDSIARVAAALMDERRHVALNPEHESKKFQRVKLARAAISDALFRWTGHQPDDLGRIPIVRGEEFLGHHATNNALTFNPIDSFAQSVLERNTTELKSQLKVLRKMRAGLDQFITQVPDLEPETLLALQVGEEVSQKTDSHLENRILAAVGWLGSSFLSGKRLLPVIDSVISLTERKLELRRTGRGRPRDEAAYAFAAALARLYALSTGKTPTFSKDADGFYGEFTPVLRDAFDHVGWRSRTLDDPANAAISSLTEADFELPRSAQRPPENSLLGGLFGLESQ
jgi:hypothetical protein